MAQTTLETDAGAQYAVLVTLSWSNLPTVGEAQTVKRYTNWTESLDINGDGSEVFSSVPNMEIKLGDVHGGTQDKPGELTISREFSPFDLLRSGLVHPKIKVKVEQIDPSNMLATRRQLFWGVLGKIRANPGGRASLVRCQINGIKAQLKQIRAGIPATPTCQWIFGDPATCGYDKQATKLSGTVLSIGGVNRVTIQLSVGAGVTPNGRYRRGTIKVAGLSLAIRQSYDDGNFDLFKTPPAWLVGKEAELFEGCDKQLSTCRVFERESRFMGLGIRIPARQPLFES